jgi:hypothetical protein
MKLYMTRTLFRAAALTAFVALQAAAADLGLQARQILNQSQACIINITAMCKLDMGGSGMAMRFGGLGEAQETQCAGTVIDASGLTVVSYTALNPMERISAALKRRTGDEDTSLKSKTEVNRIQMHLADGSEVSARLVFKDKELDLAFLVPSPKESEKLPQFTPAKIGAATTAKEVDDVVILSRHTKELGYQPIVTVTKVTSVITKPRAMYDLAAFVQPGALVYLPDGQLLGLTVSFGGDEEGFMAMRTEILVLPSSEIAKLADQAKKAADKKTAEPAKSEKN